MRHTRNKSFLWMLIVVVMLTSFTACAFSKKVDYLPERYLDWTVAEASVTMEGSTVVKSEIIVTLEGNSILLEYNDGQLKESQTISQKSAQLSGWEMVQFLKSSAKELGEITQSDTVVIGITGDMNAFFALSSSDLVHAYETSTGKIRSGFYDGAGFFAWGSIMDGDYKQVHRLILR